MRDFVADALERDARSLAFLDEVRVGRGGGRRADRTEPPGRASRPSDRLATTVTRRSARLASGSVADGSLVRRRRRGPNVAPGRRLASDGDGRIEAGRSTDAPPRPIRLWPTRRRPRPNGRSCLPTVDRPRARRSRTDPDVRVRRCRRRVASLDTIVSLCEAARLRLPELARSTAASTPCGTTGRSASSSRTTSSAPGGGRWSRTATTSSASTRGSSCTPRSG